jgi:hypothetical protein
VLKVVRVVSLGLHAELGLRRLPAQLRRLVLLHLLLLGELLLGDALLLTRFVLLDHLLLFQQSLLLLTSAELLLRKLALAIGLLLHEFVRELTGPVAPQRGVVHHPVLRALPTLREELATWGDVQGDSAGNAGAVEQERIASAIRRCMH